MSYESRGADAPGESRCRYGTSKVSVRGPERKLDVPYIAFLGGAETFGRFVRHPFVELIEDGLGRPCVNLGSPNAGLDTFLNDPETLTIARGADLCVVQVPPAHTLSNRFYRVHSRRNDRFLTASPAMASIFRNVDFTQFNFIRHMLGDLKAREPELFGMVLDELRQAWTARMHVLLDLLPRPVRLLWLRQSNTDGELPESALGHEPLWVDRDMVMSLRGRIDGMDEIAVRTSRQTGEIAEMDYDPLKRPMVGHMLGPQMHRVIAKQMIASLSE